MPTSTPRSYGREVIHEIELKNKCQALFEIRRLTNAAAAA
jgi:hypothetical protein